MNITFLNTTPPHLHLKLQGDLDAKAAVQLRELLEKAVSQGKTRVSLSLAEIDHMDAAGLAVITSCLRTLRRQGGDLWLISPSSAVFDMLTYTLLTDIIPIQSNATTVLFTTPKPIWQRLIEV